MIFFFEAQAVNWMPPPQELVPGCPPGLEYLTQIDQLLVNQQIEMFECEQKLFVENYLSIIYVYVSHTIIIILS